MIEAVRRTIQETGDSLLILRQKPEYLQVQEVKGRYDRSFRGDTYSQDKIILPRLYDHGFRGTVISEESKKPIHIGDYRNSRRRLIVDPLEASNNWRRGFPIWGVQAILEENGEMVYAIVYFPELNRRLVEAELGRGAFENGKRVHVAKQYNQEDIRIMFNVWESDVSRRKGNFISSVVRKRYADIMTTYCDAADLCELARSDENDSSRGAELTIFVAKKGELKINDEQPGSFIVEQAGGIVTRADGATWRKKGEGLIAACSEEIVEIGRQMYMEGLTKFREMRQ